jgi:hypothetical protein
MADLGGVPIPVKDPPTATNCVPEEATLLGKAVVGPRACTVTGNPVTVIGT